MKFSREELYKIIEEDIAQGVTDCEEVDVTAWRLTNKLYPIIQTLKGSKITKQEEKYQEDVYNVMFKRLILPKIEKALETGEVPEYLKNYIEKAEE